MADRRTRLPTPLAGLAPIPWPQVDRLLPYDLSSAEAMWAWARACHRHLLSAACASLSASRLRPHLWLNRMGLVASNYLRTFVFVSGEPVSEAHIRTAGVGPDTEDQATSHEKQATGFSLLYDHPVCGSCILSMRHSAAAALRPWGWAWAGVGIGKRERGGGGGVPVQPAAPHRGAAWPSAARTPLRTRRAFTASRWNTYAARRREAPNCTALAPTNRPSTSAESECTHSLAHAWMERLLQPRRRQRWLSSERIRRLCLPPRVDRLE
jgi:hypothetical protein